MKKQILAEEVDQIIQQSFWGKSGVRLTESSEAPVVEQPAPTQEEEVVQESAETHVCPLCESHLEQPISDEKLAEHVDFMVDVIDEIGSITEEDLADDGEEEEEEQG